MIQIGFGLSANIENHRLAAWTAAHQAQERLKKTKPQIVLVFSSSFYSQEEILESVSNVFPEALIAGGSAAYETFFPQTVKNGVLAAALGGDIDFEIKNFFEASGASETKKNGSKILDSENPKLVLFFAEDSFNSKKTLQNLTQNLKENDLVFGAVLGSSAAGSSVWARACPKTPYSASLPIFSAANTRIPPQNSDNYSSSGFGVFARKSRQAAAKKGFWTGSKQEKVSAETALGIEVKGDFSFGAGFGHGYEPVSDTATATKVQGNLLEEINGEPAVSFYESYFGSPALELLKQSCSRIGFNYPLAVSENCFIRCPVRSAPAGALEFFGDSANPGETVKIMLGDRESAIRSAGDAAEEAVSRLNGKKPKFVFIIESLFRILFLGRRVLEERRIIQKVVGPGVPLAGFAGRGEAEKAAAKLGRFQNGGIAVLVFGD